MTRVFVSAVALAGLLILMACSSASDGKQANTISSQNTNGATTVQSGDKITAPQMADANSVTANSTGPALDPNANRLAAKMNAAKKGGEGTIDNAEAEALAMKSAKPAPENSTFVSFLTDSGYEVRTFKDHPQLLKVVKIIGAEKSQIKVYLRGGRVVDLTGNAIINLNTVSSATILAAAGVTPPPPPTGVAPLKADPNAKVKKGE
jgi:hypothetical protein